MLNSSNLLALVHEAASEATSNRDLEELVCTNPEAHAIASNICTAPEVLLLLSNSKDYETRKAVASNPNTPTEILFKLGVEFPHELLENPVFSLLLLENPLFFQELPEDTQASLLKLEVVPDTFLQWALSYRRPKTMFAVAMNPRLTRDELCKLIYEAGCNWLTSQVANVAKLHVNWMGEMKAGWNSAAFSVVQKHQLVKDNISHDEASEYKLWQLGIIPQTFLTGLHRNTLLQIARNPYTSSEILELLSKPKTATKKIRAAIANNLNTPVHILEQLAGDDDAWVRQIVFQNPSTPNAIYKLFYEYEAAIQNPNTTGTTLSEIVKRNWEYTQMGVASHPNTPCEILAKLAYNKSWRVRAAVASNKKVPYEVLEILIDDKRLGVCNAVVRNPITPAWLLVRMLNNKSYQRQDIAKHPNATPTILEILARDGDCYVRVAVIQNPKIPIELLMHLANDKDFYVRSHVAGSFGASKTLLVQLANDSEYMVRQHVAYNLKTPIEILRKLATDEDNNVRCAVAENPRTPDDVLMQLENDEVDWVKARAKILRQTKSPIVCSSSTDQDNTLIAANPNTPIEVLFSLLQDNTYPVYMLSIQNICRQMTKNPDIPAELLEKCTTLNTLEMQIALARYPNIPESIASKFASSQSFRLRRLLARNPNLPQSVVEKLLQDKNQDVRRAALVGLLENKTINIEFLQQWQASQNPDITYEQLTELVQSKWVTIREAVALHPKSSTLLEKLAADEHISVKLAAAKNPNSPANVLELLANNPKSNNLIHLAAIKSLLLHYPQQYKSYIENIATNIPSLSNFLILMHHLAPTDLLVKHHRSSSWLERYAVATNPNTPQHIQKLLTEDANRIVRAAAKAHLL